jgi:hypothetical protein
MSKIPLFNLNAGSKLTNHEQYLKQHTLIQALLVDGPKLKTHTARLVMLKLGLLPKPRQAASHSQYHPISATKEKLYDIKL